MKDIYIVPLEKLENRYSKQWYDHIPKLIDKTAKEKGEEVNVINIDGDDIPTIPTPGAFLDFASTNIFKSSQMMIIADLFKNNKVKPNSKFLYTDFWNPTVIQLRYISELMNIPIEIHSMVHSGSYDPQDFLGRLIGDKPWVRTAEQSMFHCYDYNWFATRYHVGLFGNELLDVRNIFANDDAEATMLLYNNIKLTGWPMDYLRKILQPFNNFTKKSQIVFPHRLAPEKQVDIFKDLAKSLPQFDWIICQEQSLTKDEYHKILGESAMVFSANLQETLGISTCAEGPLTRTLPLVPKRLSYVEIFEGYDDFLYPSSWTMSFEHYIDNKTNLINKIESMMANRTQLQYMLQDYVDKRLDTFFTADPMISALSRP